MSSSDSSRDALLERLSEEFVERHRRGEHPALSEYADRYPDLATEIRDLFPALVKIEHLKPAAGDLTGDFVPEKSLAGSHTPDRLGDYRLLREIGHGGMGVVYEAEQVSLGRHVALKVLPAQGLMNPTFLERFRREAQAAARLHHTNIVPVFGVGEADGIHFYAMQFIKGQSLDEVLSDVLRLRKRSGADASVAERPRTTSEGSVAQGLLTGQFEMPPAGRSEKSEARTITAQPPTPAEPKSAPCLSAGESEVLYFRSVARIGLQAAEALAYAHRQGILHRDIKPSNLLLDQQGTVWITDFGLAKAEGADELTHTGDIVGTIRFMAPERFDGRSQPQSDVYSLGLTLYEVLTLRPAFHDANRARLIEKVLHEPPVPPRRIDPNIPRDLETIVLKCLAKDAAGRYATAEELAEDLRRFLADRTIRARRAGQWERTWRWCRRNPVVASLLGAVAVLLVAVAVVSMFSAASLRTALTRTEQAEREARVREAEALIGQAHGIRYSRRPGQRFDALAALNKAADIGHELGQPPEWFHLPRNEAIAALALPDIHITREFGSLPSGALNAELNDDFTLYARTTETGGCTIRRVADDTEVCRLPELGEHAQAKFGSGGMLGVVGTSSRRFQLWDLSGTQPILRFEEPNVQDWHSRPKGDLLGLGHMDGSISIYETSTCTRLPRLAPVENVSKFNLRLHPTAPFVAAFSYYLRVVQVRELRSGTVVASVLPPWPGGNGVCAWSPDGRTLLVPQGDGDKIQEYAFDPATPALRPTRTLQAPIDRSGNNITFHPAGDRFVVRGWQGLIDLYDAVSGQVLFSTQSLMSAADVMVNFDRTGEWLAGARVGPRYERIGLLSFAGGQEYRYLVHEGEVESANHRNGLTVHPGGQLAAIGLPDGIVFFDLDTGRELAHIVSGNVCAQFDAAGNLLTNGFEGFFRWPVRPDPANPRRLLVGPPQRLPFKPGDRRIAVSRDGRVIAQSMWHGYGMGPYSGGWVLHPSAPAPLRVTSVSTGACSVSPDGRWVAFGVERGYGKWVEVYEAATGQRVWRSPAENRNCCRFSPDGRWLLTDVDNGQMYATGTWERGPQLGTGGPVDATTDLVVMDQANGISRLVELATGRELAQLESPDTNAWYDTFTPDGTKLVVAARNGLRVWDLRRIRTGLAKLGLDWDAPPYPEAADRVPEPIEVRVVDAGLKNSALPSRDPMAPITSPGALSPAPPASAIRSGH
jgi:serine/threonine protein kinase/WD40 repeat protein